MRKKLMRSSIIVFIQAILPIIALLLITPWLIHSQLLNKLHHFFIANQSWFLVWHGVFYLALFLSWPLLCIKMSQQHQLNDEKLNKVIHCRWYLIIIFIVIDSLMLWK